MLSRELILRLYYIKDYITRNQKQNINEHTSLQNIICYLIAF